MNIDTYFVVPILVDMNNIISGAVIANEKDIIQMNKAQLAIGEDSEGESLGQYASFSYKNRWKPVDLFLTGEFWKELSVVVSPGNDFFQIIGFDEKTPDLIRRYGKNILGVNKVGIEEVPEIIKPEMQDEFRVEVFKHHNELANSFVK
jgi:hypothetical protein